MIIRMWNSKNYYTSSGTYFWHYEEYEGRKAGIYKQKYWINYRNPIDMCDKEDKIYKKINKKWVLIKEEAKQ